MLHIKRLKRIAFPISLVCTFSWLVLISSASLAQSNTNTSKERVKKRDFDASLDIPCAQIQGQAMGVCTANIARGVDGDAAIVVTFSNGFARTLYFYNGEFLRANATMSGVGTDIDWRKENGLHFIRVDDQRFEIPDGFLIGQ